MASYPIYFFSEDISYTIKDKIKVRKWIAEAVHREGKRLSEVNFIFCSDSYLIEINKEYLDHDTFTDIITFDNSEDPKSLISDIFISIDRIRENAAKFSVPERDELHRVMIHGILHLLGYKDKKPDEKRLMTQKEDEYLAARPFVESKISQDKTQT